MWIAILYLCVAEGCYFVDSPPVLSQAACGEMVRSAVTQLQSDPAVRAFDLTCIHIKMTES
jgi:hypothetical protein